ncbi:chemotaxis protein CheW [Palleronia abyssalis]|uniref:chemotaxis protein CheW n=1 Tax=Palleronia abyssalis TaxID=1501240 RepID=UPI000D557A9D|nr:chemotaxis protein CheW [Palleronia abyssalis]
MKENGAEHSRANRELIAFTVGDQSLCIDIMKVREIRGWTSTTILPHSPAYVLGVINLRGAVVPIVDLSARLGLEPIKPKARNVILVTQIVDQIVGLLVSSVSDIVSVSPDDIQPMPQVGPRSGMGMIDGMVVSGERALSILNASAAVPPETTMAAL